MFEAWHQAVAVGISQASGLSFDPLERHQLAKTLRGCGVPLATVFVLTAVPPLSVQGMAAEADIEFCSFAVPVIVR